MAWGAACHTLGQAPKGAVQASTMDDALMPDVGSHAVRALDPSVVSTKQSTQHVELRVWCQGGVPFERVLGEIHASMCRHAR